MSKVKFFDPLPLRDIPREAVYRRLRYHPGATQLPAIQKEETETYINEAKDLLQLKGAIRRLHLVIAERDTVMFETGDIVTSEQLSKWLGDVREVVLMGATAGASVTEAIGRYANNGMLARASVLDAVASETTDAALDWLMSYLTGVIHREGKTLMTTRYSPGYGDFGLENQQIFHRLLNMQSIGVTLTPQCILVPEKSVIAITGIVDFYR